MAEVVGLGVEILGHAHTRNVRHLDNGDGVIGAGGGRNAGAVEDQCAVHAEVIAVGVVVVVIAHVGTKTIALVGQVDGGRTVFVAAELLRCRPVPVQIIGVARHDNALTIGLLAGHGLVHAALVADRRVVDEAAC